MIEPMRGFFVSLLLVSACGKDKASTDKAPKGPTAYCSLMPYNINDATKGMLELREVGTNDVKVSGAIKGLNPGGYQLHLHRSAGCPRPAQGADDDANHAADLGAITADAGGIAPLELTIPSARLTGASPITEHCIVVYQSGLASYVATCRIHAGSTQ